MIYFLTERVNDYAHLNSDKITVTSDEDFCEQLILSKKFIGYDKETTSLNTFIAKELLDSLGDRDSQVVIDRTTKKPEFLKKVFKRRLYGANLKYDLGVCLSNGMSFRRVYDVMLVEKRLGLGTNRRNNLKDIYERRVGKPFPMSKEIRNDFIDWPEGKLFEKDHILYSAGDIATLQDIITVHWPMVKRANMVRLVMTEFAALPAIAEMEYEGWYLDEKAWKEIIKENTEIKRKAELELDDMMQQLVALYPNLTALSFNRIHATQGSLFSEEGTDASVASFNYSSPQQVLEIFNLMGLPVPMANKKDPVTYKKELKPSISKEALEAYLIKYEYTPLKKFIVLLLKYVKANKALNSFGERFLHSVVKKKGQKPKYGYKNPVTGRIHTVYRQVDTDTGRMASGEEDKGFYNSQQIPKEKKYRHCFSLSPQEILEGGKACTLDLSSAEVVIAASLSGETKIVEMQDIHSELATPCYRKVLRYIKQSWADDKDKQIQEALLLLSNTKIEATEPLAIQALEDPQAFEITKAHSHYKENRDDFKKVVYGLFYGGTASRIAEVLNVPLRYAQLIEEQIKKELPILFKYLEDNSKKALSEGFLVFNNRMNSRHIFQSYLDAATFKRPLTFTERGNIERASKNYTIQGTQSDMLKEAIVNIDYYVKSRNIDFKWKMAVHDEIVFAFKDDNLPEKIAKIVTDTCNRYLTNGIKMHCEYNVKLTWTK